MNEQIRIQHIARVGAVNSSETEEEHRRYQLALDAWRDGVCMALGLDMSARGSFLMEADQHYIDQGIDRPMCCGVWLDWEPSDPGAIVIEDGGVA